MMTARLEMPQPVEPRSLVRHIRTPEEYVTTSGLVDGRVSRRLTDGFKGRLVRLDLGGVEVQTGESSPAITMVGAIRNVHAFAFAMQSAVPSRVVCGRDLPPDALCHARPNELIVTSSPSNAPWPWASIKLTFEEMEQCGAALAGYNLPLSHSDMAIISAPALARERLRRLVMDASRIAAIRPDVADSLSASRALCGSIQEALVACLTQGELKPDRAVARQRHRIMARLERVLEEHTEEMLTLAQICSAVGVAERTLHLICQEFLGIGPMQYWRLLRLNRVRKALLRANPRSNSVTAIALHYGFWQLGRFAGAYRAAFGETPSETLARNA